MHILPKTGYFLIFIYFKDIIGPIVYRLSLLDDFEYMVYMVTMVKWPKYAGL